MVKLRESRPALAAFLLMVAMALTTTALSFFVTPVCEELGVGRGSFTVYYSLMTAAGAVSAPILGQVIHRRGVRCILVVSAVWVAAGLSVFSLSENLWVFYGAGAFLGVFGTACVSLCANVIVQQSYSGAQSSGILGIVMSGSGVGGMAVSLILPGLLQGLGWRWCYRLLALCWMVLCLGAFLLLGREDFSGGVGRRRTPAGGRSARQALRSPRLWLLALVMLLLSAACGIQQLLPSVLAGYGFVPERVSLMVSFFTAALALGKIAQGLLYAKVGAVRGGMAVVGAFALSFVLLLSPGLVWPALAALAVGMGCVTTWMPIVTRVLVDPTEFAPIWGILSTVSNLGALIATPLFGMVFDATSSYSTAMVTSSVGLALCMVVIVGCFREKD